MPVTVEALKKLRERKTPILRVKTFMENSVAAMVNTVEPSNGLYPPPAGGITSTR